MRKINFELKISKFILGKKVNITLRKSLSTSCTTFRQPTIHGNGLGVGWFFKYLGTFATVTKSDQMSWLLGSGPVKGSRQYLTIILSFLQLSLAITSQTYTAPKWFQNLDLCLVKMNKWKFMYSKATSS